MLNVELCSPKGTYVVIEEVHPLSGAPTKASGVGMSLVKVLRNVYQACEYQDQYLFDGRPIEAGRPTAWQIVLHMLSRDGRITTSGSGREGWFHAYAGSDNFVTPLPRISDELPPALTRQYNLGTLGSPFVFGQDPIPHVRLYRRNDVAFSTRGGTSAPRAIAVYDGRTETLKVLNDPIQRDRMLAEFMNRTPEEAN